MRSFVQRFVLVGVLWLVRSAAATEPEVLRQYFSPGGIADQSSAYCGEMKRHFLDQPTLGEMAPADVVFAFRQLQANDSSAVFAVTGTDSEGEGDCYVFLARQDETWKISAIRALALYPPFIETVDALGKKRARNADEEWEYQNGLLTLKSDRELKNYLLAHIDTLRRAASLEQEGQVSQASEIAKGLYITSIEMENGLVKFIIGGMIDNTVGIFFVPPGETLPPIDPGSYIYIEQVAVGWCVFKTT